uniref:CENP-C1 n=2 Tax=Saccharum officinarum species complex TaxID=286192 RepID=Q66LH0_SACOF|nr:CENP-C1 [Saccharum officinarum]AAU04628.1 CENP-C1 [Saccharum officinarum]AWY10676.1 putative expressed centromere protein c [Saccharum hybrid cultivar SP80-3280]AWY10701.1 putative expressed centromere protein c [Saccharum hybrid cultivar SP80-3280]
MDAADPLCAISSPARLLPRTLGPAPASATGSSPSKARDALLEAIAVARSLKGSEELLKQAKMVLKEHGDIQALYHDDGVKARPPANGSKEQQGRRPALNRKRARFTMKDTASKPMPVVDQSKLTNISDPVEYFMTLDRLEEAQEEIQRLHGGAEKRVLNFDPVDEPKRQPGFRGRKSVCSFKVIEDADTQDPIEVPASQTATTTGSQFSQDVMHVVADKNEQCVPSSSGEAISGKEDSLAEKDGRDDLTYLLTSMQHLDESEEEEFIRKTLGFKEIRKERVSLHNSIPGVRPVRSNTEQKGSMRVHPPESPLPQPRQDRISELEKHLFPRGAANAKCTDDESEGSPDIVMGEPSLVHDSSDVPMTDENFTGSEIDRETPNVGARAAGHILDPEPCLPDHAYERQSRGSSVGLCRDTEVTKENEACRRSNISVEEDDVPIDYPTIGRSTSETETSSHHLEGSSTEELVSKPGRHAAPDGIDRTLHAAEDSIQHLEVVKEGGVLQDKSSQSLEMPLEDIDPVNQPQMHGGSTKKLAPDLCNALSLTKQKKQKAAQEGKMKKQSKRGKKVADESSHALEIPQANLDSENQPHNDEVNIEQQRVLSTTPSPNHAKGQKGAQRTNKTKKLNQRKILGDAGLAQPSVVRRSTRTRSRPLEHWLGERLLYGPINDTLPAVIGIKAYSPGQDGKRTLKVKSFVPDQYSDLVAKSAKY